MRRIRTYFHVVILCIAITSCKAKKGTADSLDSAGSQKEEKFQMVYFEAQKERAIENYEKAYSKFEECLELNPDEDAIYYELAKLDTLNQNFSGAIDRINTAINLSPNNLWYEKFKVKALLETGQLSEAEKSYQSILKRDPEDVETRNNFLNLALTQNNLGTALSILSQLEDIQGLSSKTSFQKYTILTEQGKQDQALKTLEHLSVIQPFNKEAQLKIARHYASLNQTAQAVSAYEKILNIDPADGNVHLAVAEFYFKDKNPKAKLHLSKAMEDSSADGTKKCDLIELANSEKLLSESELKPLLEELRNSYPNIPKVWGLSALTSKNQPEKALNYLTNLVNLEPNNSVNWLKVVHLAKEIDLLKAEELSLEALELFPLNSEIYLARADVLIENYSYTEAISTLKNGLDITVDSTLKTEFHITLAKAYFFSKEYEMAQNWLTKSLNKLETSAHLELAGDISSKNGDSAAALNYWKKAKEKGEGSSLLEEKIANGKYIEE